MRVCSFTLDDRFQAIESVFQTYTYKHSVTSQGDYKLAGFFIKVDVVKYDFRKLVVNKKMIRLFLQRKKICIRHKLSFKADTSMCFKFCMSVGDLYCNRFTCCLVLVCILKYLPVTLGTQVKSSQLYLYSRKS